METRSALCHYLDYLHRLLFQTFLLVGPILGTMLQSVRGIISVLLGALLAHQGFIAIEEKTSHLIFLRRLATTLLMTVGIGIYLWQRSTS